MYRGPLSGGYMFCGDRSQALCSEPKSGRTVMLLKRDNTIAGSKQMKQHVSCGAHTIPHPVRRAEPRPRVHPLTRRPARHDQGREEWEPYVPAEHWSPRSSRDRCPRHTQHSTTHNAFYMEPGLTSEKSSGICEGSKAAMCRAGGSERDQRKARPLDSTERSGGTGHNIRWYSSSLGPTDDAFPFRRKNNTRMQCVSWADDEYWGRWQGWDEVIDWGDETVTDRAAKV